RPLMRWGQVSNDTWSASINDVDVSYYKCLRGSNSLEGFHKANMIPGPHCAAFRFT
ncbi:uncharacterized protein LOC114829731, partial [Tachysurus ichikawai]